MRPSIAEYEQRQKDLEYQITQLQKDNDDLARLYHFYLARSKKLDQVEQLIGKPRDFRGRFEKVRFGS